MNEVCKKAVMLQWCCAEKKCSVFICALTATCDVDIDSEINTALSNWKQYFFI